MNFPYDGRANIAWTTESLEEIKKNVDEGKAMLLDVRSPEEWNEGHIQGSIFLPVNSLFDGSDRSRLPKMLPTDKVLYAFCAHGIRALAAADELIRHGYVVSALQPGYNQLLDAGFNRAK